MNLVQYLAINRLQIPAGAVIAAYVRDGLVDVVVDQAEISPRLVAAFSIISSTFVSALAIRNAPMAAPWCTIVIDRRKDADLEKIVPEITPGGVVLPVPKKLISARLARRVSEVGTDLTRYIEPPSWLRNGEPPPPPMALRGV